MNLLVQCGLMALQGEDDLGHFIRAKLQKLKVHTSFIKSMLVEILVAMSILDYLFT